MIEIASKATLFLTNQGHATSRSFAWIEFIGDTWQGQGVCRLILS